MAASVDQAAARVSDPHDLADALLRLDRAGELVSFATSPTTEPRPTRWLDPGTTAQVIGARVLVLGPEPLIGEQRVALRLADQRLLLITDGIGPFVVADSGAVKP